MNNDEYEWENKKLIGVPFAFCASIWLSHVIAMKFYDFLFPLDIAHCTSSASGNKYIAHTHNGEKLNHTDYNYHA